MRHLLWKLKPHMLRKADLGLTSWICSQAVAHSFVDPVIGHFLDCEKNQEIKQLLVRLSKHDPEMVPLLMRCQTHWQDNDFARIRVELLRTFDNSAVPIFLRDD